MRDKTSRPKAYSYLRMSTKTQLKGLSRRRQLERSQRYAEERGLHLADESQMEDIGLSGFTGRNVAVGKLGKFLDAIRAGEIAPGSYLLCESLDRLSREEVRIALERLLSIINAGVIVVTLSEEEFEEYSAATADGMLLMRSISILSRSHAESKRKSDLIRANWKAKREGISSKKLTKWCPGWLELSRDRSEFLIIPERADVVRSIFDWCAAGMGNYSIVRRLNETNVPCFASKNRKRSDGWYGSYVARILNSRAVLGEFQPQKSDEKGGKVVAGPVIRDYFPTIVENDLFEKAKAARAHRDVRSGTGKGRKGKLLSNLFSGLCFCAYCDRAMKFEHKGSGPKGGIYLTCQSVLRGLGCPGDRWRYKDFEASFLAVVRKVDLGQIVNSSDPSASSKSDHEVHDLEARIKALRTKQDVLLDTIEKMRRPDTVAVRLDAIADEIDALTRSLANAREMRERAKAELIEFNESRAEIKALVSKIQSEQSGEDVFLLRTRAAARIQALVGKVLVASVGSVPFVYEALDIERNKKKPDRSKLRLLEQGLGQPDTKRRSFSVLFKDGSVQIGVPSPENPLDVPVQAVGANPDSLVMYDQEGAKELKPSASLRNLKFD